MSRRTDVFRCDVRLALALTLAQAAGAGPVLAVDHGSTPERHAVVLEYRNISVAFAQHPGRCVSDPSSVDRLGGYVERSDSQSTDAATVYEGLLERTTEQTLCGSEPYPTRRSTSRTVSPCRARLSGVADVHVRIKVYRTGHDLRGAWVVLTPTDVMASVSGNCGPAEMRAMREAYGERTTIEIATPPDRLVPGRYETGQMPGELGTWMLIVESAPWPSS